MIEYPYAWELDTKDRPSGYRHGLYLIPAGETGGPGVVIHPYAGNQSPPMPAYHARWWFLGSYGEDIVGQSVLEALRAREQLLNAVSESYQGCKWSGLDLAGSFGFDFIEFEARWEGFIDELTHYRQANEWFDPSEVDWVALCREAKLDPERALGADWESVVEEVTEITEPLQDEPVAGIYEYARWQAEEYRAGAWVDGPSKQ